jgi:hypothetical protein
VEIAIVFATSRAPHRGTQEGPLTLSVGLNWESTDAVSGACLKIYHQAYSKRPSAALCSSPIEGAEL